METEQIIKPIKKITGILDILICLLLFISALYKGAFYKEDSLFVSMVICMLGLVCLSVKIVLNIRDNTKITKGKLETLLDICVMIMPIAYFLPVLLGKAASKESAIFETIRYVNFAVIYFIVRTTSNKKIYLTSIVIIGVMLAIFGIDEITYRCIGSLLKPLSITYLSNSNGKISSTLQYANITGLFMVISCIIVQNKLVKNLPKLDEKNTLRFKLLIIVELFSLILLQSSILLTTSRMNMCIMLVITVIYSIYCIKNENKKSALMLVLMLVGALALVTSIDSYLLTANNFLIYFTYIITLVLISIFVILATKFKVVSNINRKTLKSNPKLIIGMSLVVVAIFTIIFVTPNSLRVKDNTGNGTMVVRNIYTKLEPQMNLEVEFSFSENSSFVFEIYEIDENFNKKMVVSITEKSVVDNKYIVPIKLTDSAENLMLTLKAINSDISIDALKLNGKKITLSYMFIPDTLAFRLKDTFIKDANNSLRFTYYLDALKLFNKSKIIGIGGEGFKSRYQEVQTKSYISSEVHSSPLQIFVESGLIGGVTFITICVVTYVIAVKLFKRNNEYSLLYILILITFTVTAIFDLVLSFGIMIYLYAILIGLVIGEYKNNNIDEKDSYELDNKSILGMLKIATLSLSLMSMFFVTIYCVNIYRASMIVVPEKIESISDSYKKVGLLENKISLDKYNISYLNGLILAYDTHIDLLSDVYIELNDENERFLLQTEINNYIVRQKEIADNIIEYEYYNKYALDTVARCYFKRYMSYAKIFDTNFKNDEIAYVFYLGYAVKLTDRITGIGKVNVLSHNMAYDIYSEYLPILQTENKMLNSSMLESIIQNMKEKQEKISTII